VIYGISIDKIRSCVQKLKKSCGFMVEDQIENTEQSLLEKKIDKEKKKRIDSWI